MNDTYIYSDSDNVNVSLSLMSMISLYHYDTDCHWMTISIIKWWSLALVITF